MTSQFWIGGGHCWESWGIPRPGVHVLFWWPCPHGRRLTTGQSRGGDRPLLSSQSTSAGQLQPLWHGPGGSVISTPLPSSEWKKWIAVNIERARLFVCFLWGPVAPGRSLRGNRSTWLSAGGSQVAAILPPCTTPLAPPPMFPKQCPPRLSSRQIFGKQRHCRLQGWNCLSVRTFKPHLPQTLGPITTPFLSMDFIFKTLNLGLGNDVSLNHFWGCHTRINHVNSKQSSHITAFLDG